MMENIEVPNLYRDELGSLIQWASENNGVQLRLIVGQKPVAFVGTDDVDTITLDDSEPLTEEKLSLIVSSVTNINNFIKVNNSRMVFFYKVPDVGQNWAKLASDAKGELSCTFLISLKDGLTLAEGIKKVKAKWKNRDGEESRRKELNIIPEDAPIMK